MTEWRAAPGLPGFEVSEAGEVRRWVATSASMAPLAFPKLVPCRLGHNGYRKFNVVKDGKLGTADLHRILALAFLGAPPTAKHHVDHIDGDRTNNALSNLRWVSPRQNSLGKKKLRRKRPLIGAAVKWAREIEGLTYAQIAERFDIDHHSARRIAACA